MRSGSRSFSCPISTRKVPEKRKLPKGRTYSPPFQAAQVLRGSAAGPAILEEMEPEKGPYMMRSEGRKAEGLEDHEGRGSLRRSHGGSGAGPSVPPPAGNVREMRKPPARISAAAARDQLQKRRKRRMIPGESRETFTAAAATRRRDEPGNVLAIVGRCTQGGGAHGSNQGREGASQSLKGAQAQTVTQSHRNFRDFQRGDMCPEIMKP